jgi:hypothetical protein
MFFDKSKGLAGGDNSIKKNRDEFLEDIRREER